MQFPPPCTRSYVPQRSGRLRDCSRKQQREQCGLDEDELTRLARGEDDPETKLLEVERHADIVELYRGLVKSLSDRQRAFRRAVAAVNRGDVDGVLDELDSEVEWHPLAQVMLGGRETVYRGHDGVRELFRELDEVTDGLHPQISEIRDLGDRIVAIGRIRAEGGESEAETESPIGWVAEYQDGKMIRIRDYIDPHEALEAVGLSE